MVNGEHEKRLRHTKNGNRHTKKHITHFVLLFLGKTVMLKILMIKTTKFVFGRVPFLVLKSTFFVFQNTRPVEFQEGGVKLKTFFYTANSFHGLTHFMVYL
jgi:hypothetical protein